MVGNVKRVPAGQVRFFQPVKTDLLLPCLSAFLCGNFDRISCIQLAVNSFFHIFQLYIAECI
jgi:hypothetical protein